MTEDARRMHLAAIIDSSDDAILSKDLDGIITSWNPGATRVYGYTAEEAIGQPISILVPEERADELSTLMARLRRGERVDHLETIRRRKGGERIHVSLTVSPIRGGRGELTGFSAVARDITTELRGQAAIARSDKRYRTLVDSLAEAYSVLEVIFDDAGEPIDYLFLEVNPAFERHTGLVDAAGRTARELVPDLESHWMERYGRIALTGTRERFVEHSPSMGRWFEVDAFRTGAPELHRVAVLFTDVTERKLAEDALKRSEERLQIAKAAAGLGIHDFNPVTGEIGWDRRTREIWGVGEDEPITYELWIEGLHPEDREPAEAAVRRALDPEGEGVYLAEYRVIHRKDGGVRWVQVTGRTTFDQGIAVRMVGTVQDISERKCTEEALREAARHKDEFLAALSHELRSPLAAICSAVSVVGSTWHESGPVAEMTSIVERQSALLVRLIDDLLDVSRVTLGKVKLDRTLMDLREVIEEVAGDCSSTCKTADLRLSVTVPDEPVSADADPVRVAQVVNNLINNACKFTPTGGEIRVALERVDGKAVLRVADTGIGMTAGELSRIFEMFEQVQSPTTDGAEGLGIGLPLAKAIVELHGGEIEARSAGPGQGSEFVVRLPLAANDVQQASTDGDAHRPGEQEGRVPLEPAAPRRIVAAEDNHDALYALTLVLQLHGHEVETAEDGNQALERVTAVRPDAALLDIDMPGIDGYEVARRIRREPWGREILLVAMTGWGQEQDKRLALEAGFDEHLTKPVDPSVLEQVFARKK